MPTTFRAYKPDQSLLLPASLSKWLPEGRLAYSSVTAWMRWSWVRVWCERFPAQRTMREFRQLHLAEFSALFVHVVRLAREAGLIKLGRLAVDGTEIRANASPPAHSETRREVRAEAR